MRAKWNPVSLSIPAVAYASIVAVGLVTVGALPVATAPLSAGRPSQAEPQPNRVNDDARTMAAFVKRVSEYEAVRRSVERSLPKRDEKASPEGVVGSQRALADGIRRARANAQPGDLFTPETQPVLRAMLAKVFAAPKVGSSAKAAVNEENPRGTRVAVNAPYPDGAPLTTMPPEVLRNLPPLPESLHYHFVGKTLILLDSDARIIVDFMPNAMP